MTKLDQLMDELRDLSRRMHEITQKLEEKSKEVEKLQFDKLSIQQTVHETEKALLEEVKKTHGGRGRTTKDNKKPSGKTSKSGAQNSRGSSEQK